MSWNSNPKTRKLKSKLAMKEHVIECHIEVLDEYRADNDQLRNQVAQLEGDIQAIRKHKLNLQQENDSLKQQLIDAGLKEPAITHDLSKTA